MMRGRIALLLAAALAVIGLNLGPSMAQSNARPKAVRVAIVTFFSGSGTVSGVPQANFAKMMIDEINETGGIAGVPIQAQYVDETGGPSKNVTEFRQLAAQHPDAVLGYISSADCLAVAPVAEELHQLTIFSGCTTDALFEGHHYAYVFRTIPPTSSSAVAGAMYLLTVDPSVKTIAGINPDYAYGRDEWKYFTEAMHSFRPDVRPVGDLWPQLGAGNYSSEISRLVALHPDAIYSSLWGGDLIAFIQQALAQGLFQQSKLVFASVTEAGLKGLEALPDGVIGGSNNTYLFHPGPIRRPAVKRLIDTYRSRFGEYPVTMYAYPSQTSLEVLRAAYHKAMAQSGGQWPTQEALAAALVGIHIETPLGPLAIRSDHNATYHEEYGISVHVSQYPFAVFNRIVHFPADLIIAPVGTTAEAWIESLKPGYLSRVPKATVYPTTP
jgi:branched-chain amino acid transport system substrate-binding protein